ncbi:phage tail tape measure protein [Arthrobacter luteolus]|uniref:phage tail tape measure protein n=1 Tax=Arthrobacter luteolus TaxID=98672 RepID=UPI000830BB54|nr:phage tail tape measure protein [Arthrobacter luteolus]
MAERSVVVKLQAQVGQYVTDLGKAKQSTDQLANAQDRASSKATEAGRKHEESSQKQEQSSKRTANQLTAEAAAMQMAADKAGLKYQADGRLVDSQGRVLSSSQAAAHGLDSFSDSVYLTALAAGEAAPAVENVETRLESLARKAKDVDAAGQAMVGFGTVTIAGLGAVSKAAMDWESAWAGVTKTVDGTPEQMAELEAGLRGLARELPATHAEIAGVAEAAGQLGVKREDVLGFTRTMIDLSETTNLTADEAATAIAQISNVMGTMEREGSQGIARFGAALVLLGNNGASTEKEIVMMAQRIAGAAKLVGASEADLLAMANAMASVGIEAQLGGGVMSRVMQRMYGDVMTGGEGLDNLAKIAGTTSAQFAEDFGNDPVRAVDAVVQGLNRVKESGSNVISTMTDLGIKGTEETSVILRLAGAGTILSDSLDQGAQAWAANTALVEEAEKRYATTEAQVQMAWNSIKDAAIDAGAVLLPIISTVAEGTATLANGFGALPAPVQGVVTVLGGVAGVAALALGGFILLFPKVMDTVESFKKLQEHSSGAASGLTKVGKAAAVAGAIAAVGLALAKVVEANYMDDIDTGMGRIADAFADVTAKGPGAADALDRIFQDRDGGSLINNVSGLDDALDRMFKKSPGEKFNDFSEGIINGVTGIDGSSQILKGSFDRMDQGLATLVSSGNAADAEKVFSSVTRWAKENKVPLDEVSAAFPQYGDALAAVSAEQKLAAADGDELSGSLQGVGEAASESVPMTEEAAEALEEVGLAADGTIASLDKYLDSLFAAGLAVMDTREATFQWADTLRDMDGQIQEILNSQSTLGAVLDETGTKLNINTDAGKGANEMLIGMAREGLSVAQVMANDMNVSLEEVQGQLSSTYNSLVHTGQGFGMTEADAISMAREVLQVPDDVSIESWMSDEATRRAQALTGELNKLDGRVVRTYIETTETLFKKTVLGESHGGAKPGGGVLLPGGALGGRVDDIMTGYWSGGRLPGPAHPTKKKDNLLGLVNGKPVGLQGTEWVINPFSSKEYDTELAAINAGTFPRSDNFAPADRFGRTYTAPPAVASAAAGQREMHLVGQLYLDSGELLGTVRGIAKEEAGRVVSSIDSAVTRIQRGGKYAGGM